MTAESEDASSRPGLCQMLCQLGVVGNSCRFPRHGRIALSGMWVEVYR